MLPATVVSPQKPDAHPILTLLEISVYNLLRITLRLLLLMCPVASFNIPMRSIFWFLTFGKVRMR